MSHPHLPPTHHLTEQVSTVASYGASGAAVFLGITVDEWGIIGVMVGMGLGIATFLFNMWFKMKYNRKQND